MRDFQAVVNVFQLVTVWTTPRKQAFVRQVVLKKLGRIDQLDPFAREFVGNARRSEIQYSGAAT